MARLVTRTIELATINATTADRSTMKMENREFSFSANLKDEDSILREIQKENQTDTLKIISVDMSTIKKESAIYGMSETDFLRYARKMETRFKMESEQENVAD